ncbi:MAG: beta-propeller domain-containing protein [Lachnospiraceae bacterium]|nr:beta-propeller domain-containing protein [Lachnospiraceae bacterium]
MMEDKNRMKMMVAQFMEEYDENPRRAVWKRNLMKGVLVAVLLAVAFQIVYGGILFVLAKRGEGKLQTASSYKAIEKNFCRVMKQQTKVLKRIEFYENPFQGKYYIQNNVYSNLGALMSQSAAQVSSGSSGENLALAERGGVGSVDVDTLSGTETSKTNVEEEGVVEADEVIADGGYIYAIHKSEIIHYDDDVEKNGKWVYILKLGKNGCEQVGKIRISFIGGESDDDAEDCGLYVWMDTLVVIESSEEWGTEITAYDISNPENPVKTAEIEQSGVNVTSRLIDNRLVVVTRYLQDDSDLWNEDDISEALEGVGNLKPSINEESIPAEDIYMQRDLYMPGFAVVGSYRMERQGTLEVADKKAVTGRGERIYMKGSNLYILNHAVPKAFDKADRTGITKLKLDEEGKIIGMAHRVVDGWIGEGFAIKEEEGHLRLCMSVRHFDSEWCWKQVEVPFDWYLGEYYSARLKMTVEMYEQTIAATGTGESSRDISVIVLDENLENIGKTEGLCEGNRIQTARFVGDYLYAVGEEENTLLQINMATEEIPTLMDSIQTVGEIAYIHPLGKNSDSMIALGKDVSGELTLTFYKTVAGKGMEQIETYPLVQRSSDAMNKYTKILVQKTEDGCYLGFATRNAGGLQYPLVYFRESQGVETVLRSESNNRSDHWCRGLFIGGRFYVLRDSGVNMQVERYDTGAFRQTGVWNSKDDTF